VPYRFQVAAVNCAGVGADSEPSPQLCVAPEHPPTPPPVASRMSDGLDLLEAEYVFLCSNWRPRGHALSRIRPHSAVFTVFFSVVFTRIPLYSLYSSPLYSRGALKTLHKTVFPPSCWRMPRGRLDLLSLAAANRRNDAAPGCTATETKVVRALSEGHCPASLEPLRHLSPARSFDVF